MSLRFSDDTQEKTTQDEAPSIFPIYSLQYPLHFLADASHPFLALSLHLTIPSTLNDLFLSILKLRLPVKSQCKAAFLCEPSWPPLSVLVTSLLCAPLICHTTSVILLSLSLNHLFLCVEVHLKKHLNYCSLNFITSSLHSNAT